MTIFNPHCAGMNVLGMNFRKESGLISRSLTRVYFCVCIYGFGGMVLVLFHLLTYSMRNFKDRERTLIHVYKVM